MCCCEKQCGSICVCFQKLPSLCSTPRKFSADCELKGRKTKEGKAGGAGDRGIPAHVSSRHKWRKLATLLFPTAPPPRRDRCCGLQMLDPAVGLLGHTDLHVFLHPNRSLNGPAAFSPWGFLCLHVLHCQTWRRTV